MGHWDRTGSAAGQAGRRRRRDGGATADGVPSPSSVPSNVDSERVRLEPAYNNKANLAWPGVGFTVLCQHLLSWAVGSTR